MIEVTLKEESKQEEKPFPKLMSNKHTGNIYLFHSEYECTLLSNGKTYKDREPLTTECTDYNGEITIKNK